MKSPPNPLPNGPADPHARTSLNPFEQLPHELLRPAASPRPAAAPAPESSRASNWRDFLFRSPERMCEAETVPAPGDPAGKMIRVWEEIPDAGAIDAPKVEWLAEGIIPRASVTLLAGEPGSYKSWLALALVRGVAQAKEGPAAGFLGRACGAADVLYLDRENPLSVVRERLALLRLCTSPRVKIWGGWLRDAPPGIGDARLVEIARERRPLVIFDSLIRFHAADENSATEMAEVMQELRVLANAGATVVALHHRAKSEASRYRGSSDIAGGVDMAFAVSRDRQAGLVKLDCFKSRFAQEFAITFRPDLTATGEFVVADLPPRANTKTDVERLAEIIRDSPGLTQSQVLAKCDTGEGKARNLLRRFDGEMWRAERGRNNCLKFFPLESRNLSENERLYPD